MIGQLGPQLEGDPQHPVVVYSPDPQGVHSEAFGLGLGQAARHAQRPANEEEHG